MGKDRQAEGTVLLGLVLRPCWPAGGVQSLPLTCCHAELCFHRCMRVRKKRAMRKAVCRPASQAERIQGTHPG